MKQGQWVTDGVVHRFDEGRGGTPMRTKYYIQAKPPTEGVFIHHACYSALKLIHLSGLREKNTYKGISFTTDIGRYTSPLPLFGATVDGFVEFPSESIMRENLFVPCLYLTTDEDLVTRAVQNGHNVFAENPTPEYKYILHLVTKRDMFVGENEWLFLGQYFTNPDLKLYIRQRMYKRLMNSLTKRLGFTPKDVFPLESHPKWTHTKPSNSTTSGQGK